MTNPNSFVQTILLDYMQEHGIDAASEEGKTFLTCLGLLQTASASGGIVIHDPLIDHSQLTSSGITQEVEIATLKIGEAIDRVFVHITDSFAGGLIDHVTLIVHDFDNAPVFNLNASGSATDVLNNSASFVANGSSQGNLFNASPRTLTATFTANGVELVPNITGTPTGAVDIIEFVNNGYGYQIGDTGFISGGGNGDATYVIDAVFGSTGPILSLHLYSPGNGYQAGDTFEVIVGAPVAMATGVIDTVDGGGGIQTFHMTSGGDAGYQPGVVGIRNTSRSLSDNAELFIDSVAGFAPGTAHVITKGTGYPATFTNMATTKGGSQAGSGKRMVVDIRGFEGIYTVVAVMLDGRHSARLYEAANARPGQILDWSATAVPGVDHYDVYLATGSISGTTTGKVATIPGNQTTWTVQYIGGDNTTGPNNNTLGRLSDLTQGTVNIYLEIINLAP